MGKIMVLSLAESEDKVYEKIMEVVKEFDVAEQVEEIEVKDTIQVGRLRINPVQHTVFKGKEEIQLTQTEFRILYFFALHQGMVLSKDQIYGYTWNEEYALGDSNITSHIRRLRMKIEDDPAQPQYIQTVRGIGYKMPKQTT